MGRVDIITFGAADLKHFSVLTDAYTILFAGCIIPTQPFSFDLLFTA